MLKDLHYLNIKNLLQGDVFLIKKINDMPLDSFDLKYILNQTNILVRFLFLNQLVYNVESIKKLIIDLNNKKDLKEIPIVMSNVIWQQSILNNLNYKHCNYKKKINENFNFKKFTKFKKNKKKK